MVLRHWLIVLCLLFLIAFASLASATQSEGGINCGVYEISGETWAFIEIASGQELISAPFDPSTGVEDPSRIRLLGFSITELESLEGENNASYVELLRSDASVEASMLWETGCPTTGRSAAEGPVIGRLSQHYLFFVEKAAAFDPDAGWVANGCTAVPDFDFTDCCDMHDECYCAGGTAADRKACDQAIRECIENRGHPFLAGLYYFGVRAFGSSHFSFASSPAGVLVGGSVTRDLSEGTGFSFTFTNSTPQRICDLLLSTQESFGIDPDFEGDVIVRKPPGEANLNWDEDPAPADGVEDIKTFATGKDNCIAIGESFSVGFTVDGADSDDMVRISPTNVDMHQIQALAQCQQSDSIFEYFNGYDELLGSLSGTCALVNPFPEPIVRIRIESITEGVSVVDAVSSHGFSFDPLTGLFGLIPPVAPGESFDYTVFLDGLAPFVSDDPDPFTRAIATVDNVSTIFADGFESGDISLWSGTAP